MELVYKNAVCRMTVSFVLVQLQTIMNRWIPFLVVCMAIWRIDARPQTALPFDDSLIAPSSPNIIPIRRPVFLLRPNGQIIFLPSSILTNYDAPAPIPVPLSIQTPMLNPLPIPNSQGGSFLPLAIFPNPNQFDPFVFSNGFFNQRTTTPVSTPNVDLLDPENQSTTSPIVVNTQQATTTLTAVTQLNESGNASSPPVPISQPTTSNPNSIVTDSSAPSTLDQQANGDYNFHYSVNNKDTGDVKSQEEKQVNGVVTGYYMLMEADGTFRKVDYTADAQGFRATISKMPPINN